MEMTYTKIGDYYFPNIIHKETKQRENIGKYGRLRLEYLKQHKRGEYICLRIEGGLNKHLYDIEEECKDRVRYLVNELAEKENINEDLKEKNQLKWVGTMNNFKNIAEEIVMQEIILM